MNVSPRRMPRAERRLQIVSAAAAAFHHAGFDGTSMEDVARRAGVTRLIVYRIFESKELLYRAVLDSVLGQLVVAFSGRQEELLERRGIAGLLLDTARQQPDAFRLLWRHAAHEPAFVEYAAEFRQGVSTYADEVLQPVIIDAALRRWAARTITAYLHDAICAWLDDGDTGANAFSDVRFAAMLSSGSSALVYAWLKPSE